MRATLSAGPRRAIATANRASVASIRATVPAKRHTCESPAERGEAPAPEERRSAAPVVAANRRLLREGGLSLQLEGHLAARGLSHAGGLHRQACLQPAPLLQGAQSGLAQLHPDRLRRAGADR